MTQHDSTEDDALEATDIWYSKEQVEEMLEEKLRSDRKHHRSKRKIENFDQKPDRQWDTRITYVFSQGRRYSHSKLHRIAFKVLKGELTFL